MKKILILVLLFISTLSLAQIKYNIEDFSKDYYGIVNVSDTNDFFRPGVICIYDKKTNEELIKVENSRIYLDFEDGKLIEGNNVVPYEHEPVIIYQDFNFDGVNDFAIQDSERGCYGAISYNIYLAQNKKFVYNNNFSELAHDYCGMFVVDYEKKLLYAMQKDGCCYIEHSDFKVENNEPKLISLVIEDATKSDDYVYITTKKLKKGKWIKTEKKEKIKDYYKE